MKQYKGTICIIAGFLMMLCLGAVYSWSVFRTPIESHFQINSLLSGLPYMTSLVFYSVFMVLTGENRTKLPFKTWMYIGAFLISAGWILSAFSTQIATLTLLYGCMVGAGVGIMYGIPMLLVAQWFPKLKGVMVGVVLAGFGVSPLISAPVARALIVNKGIMPTFLYIGIAFAVLLPLLSSLMDSPDTASTPVQGQPVELSEIQVPSRDMLKLPSFRQLYICYFLGTAIGLTMIGLSYPVGVEYLQASPQSIAWMISLFAICNGLGRPFFGWFTDRFSPISSMRLSFGLIVSASLLMLIFRENSLVVFGLSFCVFWFNLGGWLALAPAATLRFYGVLHFSQNYGFLFTAYGAGALFGVLASGFLKDWLGHYQGIFWFVLVLAFLGILFSRRFAQDQA